jgi:hypothetical protein
VERAKAYIAMVRQGKARIEKRQAKISRLGLATLVLASTSSCSTVNMGRLPMPQDIETIRATGDPLVTVPGRDGEQRGELLEVGTTQSVVQLARPPTRPWLNGQLAPQFTYYTISVDNQSIRKVTAVSHARGALDGLEWGALAGATLGVVGAAVSCHSGESGCYFGNGDQAMLVSGVVFGLTGALYGVLIGGLIGHRTTYWFE